MAYSSEAKAQTDLGALGEHTLGGTIGAAVGAAAGAATVMAVHGAILGTVAGLPGMAVGAVVGAAAGAATVMVVQGAILGTVAGLPGMGAGLAIGGVVGALAGKEAAQIVKPTTEDAYWRDNYKKRTYFDSLTAYDSYAPAYRYGLEAYSTYVGRNFDEIEAQLAKGWGNARGTSRLTWATARLATRDAYERLYNRAD